VEKRYGIKRPDPLEILNLKANATRDEINARYRALTKQLHPDLNAGSEAASGLLRQVMDAMETLRREGRA
jgi:curved DNA-binding protein CbpA